MVLYYLFPSSSRNEVNCPQLTNVCHWLGKGFQYGIFAGAAAGVWTGLRFGKTYRHALVSFARSVQNVGIGGAACGAAYGTFLVSSRYSAAETEKHAFKLQRDIWMNRLDVLTFAGFVLGGIAAQPQVWQALRLPGLPVPWGGPCLGALWFTMADVPICIFGPTYLSNIEDINPAGVTQAQVQDDDDDDEEEADEEDEQGGPQGDDKDDD